MMINSKISVDWVTINFLPNYLERLSNRGSEHKTVGDFNVYYFHEAIDNFSNTNKEEYIKYLESCKLTDNDITMVEKILTIISDIFDVPIEKLTSNSHEISICDARCACMKTMLYCGISKDEALRTLNITKNTGNNALNRYNKLFLENRTFTDRVCKAILLLDGIKIDNYEA